MGCAKQRLGISLTPRSRMISNEQAKIELLAATQRKKFQAEILKIESNHVVENNSPLYAFFPFLDENRLMRKGSRLEQSELPWRAAFPVLLPRDL